MIIQKLFRVFPFPRGPRSSYRLLSSTTQIGIINNLCKILDINESFAKFICIRYPVVTKMNVEEIRSVTEALNKLGFRKDVLVAEPALLSILPITLMYRFKVLEECGVEPICHTHLVTYLKIVRNKTIKELKQSGDIQTSTNIENRLTCCLTKWPLSSTVQIHEDVNNVTLSMLRSKVLQRYLELCLDLSEEEYHRGVNTYPTIKHRPLRLINETLQILQSQIVMPIEKIRSNFYLLHADPINLKHLIYQCKSLGGIDIKEVIRMHPKIAVKNYLLLMKIKEILNEFDVSDEAQRRCFDIFTLGPETVRERLIFARSIPEFQPLFKHPRFLRIIHYNKAVMRRLKALYDADKKCLSLDVMSGSAANFDLFKKSQGDRLGKGKDLVFAIMQFLENKFKANDVHKAMKRHPFWINTSVSQAMIVHEKLRDEYSSNDIYENLPILFYPWNKVKNVLYIVNNERKRRHFYMINECLDLSVCSKSQKLSLALYLLEWDHHFSGNGVWSVEKNNSIESLNTAQKKLVSFA